MSTIDVIPNTDDLTMTITTTFDATVERVWQLWEDPRKLERWWGPPAYPATVVDHDLRAGGQVGYYMTGPEGDQHGGLWRVIEVDRPTRLVFEDAFADEHGDRDTSMPSSTTEVTLEHLEPSRTAMHIRTRFPSPEAMQQLLDMGMQEGITQAIGQIPAILAED